MSRLKMLSEAADIYRYNGPASLLLSALRFGNRRLLSPWHLTGADIYEECSQRFTVQSQIEKTLSYEGKFREELPQPLARIEGTLTTPERVIGEYEDAHVMGPAMLVRIGRSYIVPVEVGSARLESPTLSRNVSVIDVAKSYLRPDAPDRRVERGYLLTGKRGLPFAHWFYETLPKLRWYERYCALIGERPPLLLPAGLTDWQRESLRLMGYTKESWIECGRETVEVECLAIPPHPYRNRGSDFTGSPRNLQWIRDRMLSNLTDKSGSYPSRIYVSRDDAPRRQVRNEDEVMNVLSEFGFVKFVLSELAFEEQVRLFSGADVVVGPHGAGLTNMLYATDLDVVELITIEGAAEHFFVLSNELGHNYEFARCDPVSDPNTPPRHTDMTADTVRLREIMTDLGLEGTAANESWSRSRTDRSAPVTHDDL
ncbi:glycosyltransferase family 61 protein [Salinigranum salinum]|uniref:glycosyltransferase family 61 protein n=1 Tax=Salinigranum salinum TaxID=1364937 RepID=UPI001260881A|nr:glycosyltransferase family 61 protein [Salinigranum salinum]